MFDAAYEAAEEPTVLLRLHVLSFRDGRFCFEAKVSYNYKLFLMNYYLIKEKDIFLNSLEMISCYFMHNILFNHLESSTSASFDRQNKHRKRFSV